MHIIAMKKNKCQKKIAKIYHMSHVMCFSHMPVITWVINRPGVAGAVLQTALLLII